VQEATAIAEAATAGVTQAFGTYLPSIDINGSYSRQITNLEPQLSFINGVPIVGEPLPNFYTLSAGLNWTIFNGFARESNYDQAGGTLDATDRESKQTRLRIGNTVRRQFIEVLAYSYVVRARKENAEVSKQTLERIRAQVEAGTQPITALYSQETDVANQEFDIISAENDLQNSKARLLVTMGLNANEPAEFLENSIEIKATPDDVRRFRERVGSEDAAITRALRSRNDVSAADRRIDAARASVKAAQATYWPTINATGSYNWRNFEVSNFDRQSQVFVGLNFRIPVFDQFRTYANTENATLTLTQRQLDRVRLEQKIRQDIQAAYLALSSAERQLQVSERALRSAELNYEAAVERFNVGGATQLDVFTANSQLITARINRIRAVFTYYDAQYRAEYETGLF
jgi:outer membrane protein